MPAVTESNFITRCSGYIIHSAESGSIFSSCETILHTALSADNGTLSFFIITHYVDELPRHQVVAMNSGLVNTIESTSFFGGEYAETMGEISISDNGFYIGYSYSDSLYVGES